MPSPIRLGWALMRWWGWGLCIAFSVSAWSAPHFLTQAEVVWPEQTPSAVQLPHFLSQEHSGLMRAIWSVRLTTIVHQQQLPALLIPQPIQGLVVKVGQQTVYRLEPSSEVTLHNWYRPILIPLPTALFDSAIPPTVHIEQTGHLRGWYIAPLIQGELSELQAWHDRFWLLSNTLPSMVNGLSMLVGLFVVIIGWRTRSASYWYGGLTTVIWAILFSLALVSEWPAKGWFAWRFLLYLCTGNLIFCVMRFMLAIFRQALSPAVQWALFWSMQSGWILFGLMGRPIEATLDIVWTGIAVVLYGVSSTVVIWRGIQHAEWRKLLALGAHGALTIVLALHDYVLQAGTLNASDVKGLPLPWFGLLVQPIYLTHLALPVFVFVSLWLLAQDHLQHQVASARHHDELTQQRARIVGDIHDGVGARLNVMLWRMRTEPLASTQIQDELERSIEELRFAINPELAGGLTLSAALQNLCSRFARLGADVGLAVRLDDQTQELKLRSDQGLHLYKAAHECVSNAMRHSGATCIVVRLSTLDHHLHLDIQDNGHGIPGWDAHTQRQAGARPTAMGLNSVHQRLASIGGRANIQSSDQGTWIALQLPLEDLPRQS